MGLQAKCVLLLFQKFRPVVHVFFRISKCHITRLCEEKRQVRIIFSFAELLQIYTKFNFPLKKDVGKNLKMVFLQFGIVPICVVLQSHAYMARRAAYRRLDVGAGPPDAL